MASHLQNQDWYSCMHAYIVAIVWKPAFRHFRRQKLQVMEYVQSLTHSAIMRGMVLVFEAFMCVCVPVTMLASTYLVYMSIFGIGR